jgi:hypothetical protein
VPDGYPISLQKNKTCVCKIPQTIFESVQNTAIDISKISSLGDDTWVKFNESERKIHNKIWATKNSKKKCIAKCTMSVKRAMYVIFKTNQGSAI